MVKEKIKIFDAVEFNNIKDLMYHVAEKYKEKIAFVIKHKKEKEVSYENVTYTRLLEDINKLGTAFYAMKLQGKRIAIIGKNSSSWSSVALICAASLKYLLVSLSLITIVSILY